MKRHYRIEELNLKRFHNYVCKWDIPVSEGFVVKPESPRQPRYGLIQSPRTIKPKNLLSQFVDDKQNPVNIWQVGMGLRYQDSELKTKYDLEAHVQKIEESLNQTERLIVWLARPSTPTNKDMFEFRTSEEGLEMIFMALSPRNYNLYQIEGLNPQLRKGNAAKFFAIAP